MKVDCRIRAGSRNIPRRSAGRSGAGRPREEMAEVVRAQGRGLEGDGGGGRGAAGRGRRGGTRRRGAGRSGGRGRRCHQGSRGAGQELVAGPGGRGLILFEEPLMAKRDKSPLGPAHADMGQCWWLHGRPGGGLALGGCRHPGAGARAAFSPRGLPGSSPSCSPAQPLRCPFSPGTRQ